MLLTQVHLLQCLPALWAVMLEQFLRAVTPCEGWYSMLEQHAQHATATLDLGPSVLATMPPEPLQPVCILTAGFLDTVY